MFVETQATEGITILVIILSATQKYAWHLYEKPGGTFGFH